MSILPSDLGLHKRRISDDEEPRIPKRLKEIPAFGESSEAPLEGSSLKGRVEA